MENPPQIMRTQEGQIFILHSSVNSVRNEDLTTMGWVTYDLIREIKIEQDVSADKKNRRWTLR